jgi:hypothetical protein
MKSSGWCLCALRWRKASQGSTAPLSESYIHEEGYTSYMCCATLVFPQVLAILDIVFAAIFVVSSGPHADHVSMPPFQTVRTCCFDSLIQIA